MPFFIILALVTAYAPSAGGINAWGDGSITHSGLPPSHLIAGCASPWELGDILYIPHYGSIVCGDRFGSKQPPWTVDVFMDNEEDAYQWGIQKLQVIYLGHIKLPNH